MYGSVYSYEVYSFLRRYGYRGIHDLGKCGYYSSSLTGLTLALVEASLVESSTLTVSPFAGSPLSVEATLVLLSLFSMNWSQKRWASDRFGRDFTVLVGFSPLAVSSLGVVTPRVY